ncbi:ubiquitin carboxyl-terminal hydrolase 12 isoform X2 [Dendrobium catenatum]|uniref:ubiquitin carboxyl-terminal hydrolase 12 isoform X2 n=1 Tax=Dendrobium catenatum TaxID=906689 RepID=UPI00109F186F|nr:ubiquitin carboxyl-terminal hydrolase 12 isoform X2 [Dendrobium catenatum]
MWLSRLFSGRKGAQYPKTLHNKGSGDLIKGEMKGSKTSGGFTSDFTVKDSSAYDFLWTIKSFSKLPADNESKQTSGRFEAKGYSWKLILYPNGNIVNGQISLYLMLSRATSHPTEAVFKVSYELFLFNQKTGSTLSQKGENLVQVQDEMGFRNLIDLKGFKDSSNGYLLNENCMFGVKIFQVVPIQTNTECLQPVEKISHEYTWKIENFSKIDKKKSHERKFTAGDYLWSIVIHPEGDQKSDIKVKGKNMSLYLYYNGSI